MKKSTQLFFVAGIPLMTIAICSFLLAKDYDESLKLSGECPECPSCQITTQRIMNENPVDHSGKEIYQIKLPKKDKMKVKIGEDIFTYSITDKDLKKEEK